MTDLYVIEQTVKDDNYFVSTIRLNASHPVYKGHFPGVPVTPGVCLLHMIRDCVSGVLHKKIRYKEISNCKFLAVVNPVEQERLSVSFSLNEVYQLQVTAHAGDKPVLKLKATLTEV